MNPHNDSSRDIELDHELSGAYRRLRSSASHIDTLAALRSLEATKPTSGFRLIPALAACCLVAVAAVAGLSLANDNRSTAVTSTEPDATFAAQPDGAPAPMTIAPTATPNPTTVPTVEPTVLSIESVVTPPTPTPVAPDATPSSEPAATVEPTPEGTLDTAEEAAAALAAALPSLTPDDESRQLPTMTPTPTADETPSPRSNGADLATGGGPFVGVWELRSRGQSGAAPNHQSTAEVRILSGGQLFATQGCWTAEASVETDGDSRLQIVPGTLDVQAAVCSDSNAPIMTTLGNLKYAYVADGNMLWTSDVANPTAAHTTSWNRSTTQVVPVLPNQLANPTPTPTPQATAVPTTLPDDRRLAEVEAFAGSWKLISDGPADEIDVEATLFLSPDGDLTLDVSCKIFEGRIQTDGDVGLKVDYNIDYGADESCDDPAEFAMANRLAYQLDHALALFVVDGDLQWVGPNGAVFTFEPS